MNILQTLKEFCTDKGELQYLCKEFNCSEYENVYTKEQAELMANENEKFKILMKTMNKKETEEEY